MTSFYHKGKLRTGHRKYFSLQWLDSRLDVDVPGDKLQTGIGKFCCIFLTRRGNCRHELHCSRKKLFGNVLRIPVVVD